MLVKKSKHYTTIKLYYKDSSGIQTTVFRFLKDSLEFNISLDTTSFDTVPNYTIKLHNIISGGYLESKLMNFIDQFKVKRGGCGLNADISYNKLKYIFHNILLEVHYNHFYYNKWDICDIILKPGYFQLQF